MARSIVGAASKGGSRNRGVLLLAAVFGILSAILVFAFLQSKGGDDGAMNEAINGGAGATSVLVVTRDVAVGEKITDDMVTPKTLPASALLPGYVTKSEDVVGKVATTPMVAGEQVLDAKVTTFAGQTTLTYKVPEGMRGLALMVPHEAWIAAGLPQPGDRVDVLGITTLVKVDPLTGQERPDIVTGIIAQDVLVLAVSQSLVKTVPNLDKDGNPTSSSTGNAGGAQSDDEAGTYEKSISITLALTPELAAKVALIDAMKDDEGQYRILARQKGDASPIAGAPTWSLEDVFAPKK